MTAIQVVIAALVLTFTAGLAVGWMVRGFAETAKSDDDPTSEFLKALEAQVDERHQWRNSGAKAPHAE